MDGVTVMGEQKYSEKNFTSHHFAHHKSHMNWPGIEPRPL
jgi:hypothetical protein